jgi:undecaprenyl pyrophosphate phosphatase UppP
LLFDKEFSNLANDLKVTRLEVFFNIISLGDEYISSILLIEVILNYVKKKSSNPFNLYFNLSKYEKSVYMFTFRDVNFIK